MDNLTPADFEPVIGLEIHMQLLTQSKAYSPDAYDYGADPNTNVSAITLGHPGTLPFANAEVVNEALKLGLACNCDIERTNEYARKNYFYADLPKGYQITQQNTPICRNGHVVIEVAGEVRHIALTRIHWEEDAGKSLHDQDLHESLVDLNRCGVPLLEMVTEPVIRNSEEAYAFLNEVRKIVRHLGICDGNMEEGSLRCDVNVSVKRKGVAKFGTKVEVKNMNSFRNVARAIEHEIARQVAVIIAGGTIASETRTFDAAKGTTAAMRSKELANDYRYFPEPDLPPVFVTENMLVSTKATLPALPRELLLRFKQAYELSDYDAGILAEDATQAAYFEAIIASDAKAKTAANWMLGPIRSHLNGTATTIADFPVAASQIGEAAKLVDAEVLSFSAAAHQLFAALLQTPAAPVERLVDALALRQNNDSSSLEALLKTMLAENPAKVAEYKNGKKGIVGMFMGQLMKAANGQLNPKQASAMLTKALDEA